ncbi:YiiD C-terminal domain-containing protein [Amphritea sp. 2_MG-2023]|jgi:thioesterase domain-containing protein|uniref:YiiD C-terminal domain-containing protein n=1 Tax=Amphritea TaxID=515417 RepID=UPI001C07E27E|nr:MULTISPECIES: YiiD C-terminal domain-containing protein [Amphritea]MBU2967359.1 thioesterase domain-containing protein [Amphritea atlantica]MDO6418386.1 YiiD C-terminal domain-containing protein [Amphritea sp. 2_MG-2023]
MTKPMNHQQTAETFQVWLKDQIPLISHMGIGEPVYDGRSLTLRAALAPNVNDKGTGFGGSLATLATLCGWAIVTLYLREQGRDCDVMIRDSQLKYLAPVTGDFTAVTVLPEQAELDLFMSYLEAKGRGRLNLNVEIRQGDTVAMTLAGAYVAVERLS